MIDLTVFTDNNLWTRQHFILPEIHYIFIIQHFMELQIIMKKMVVLQQKDSLKTTEMEHLRFIGHIEAEVQT